MSDLCPCADSAAMPATARRSVHRVTRYQRNPEREASLLAVQDQHRCSHSCVGCPTSAPARIALQCPRTVRRSCAKAVTTRTKTTTTSVHNLLNRCQFLAGAPIRPTVRRSAHARTAWAGATFAAIRARRREYRRAFRNRCSAEPRKFRRTESKSSRNSVDNSASLIIRAKSTGVS